MSKNKHNFKTLLPTDNAELGVYKDALNFALDDKKINNIAITGPYGSGKSSILESYKKQLKDDVKRNFDFLNISLTGFKSTDYSKKNTGNNSSENLTNINTETLEGKILNQLIHQVNPKDIPLSNFKLKKASYKKKIVLFVLSLFFVFFSIVMLFLSKYNGANSSHQIINELANFFKAITQNVFPAVFLFLGSVALLSIWLYLLVKKQYEKRLIKKLSLQGAEIEIFSEQEPSIFNKYLNEVIYIFQKSNCDVIVFEDLDRIKNAEIFIKLRELNHLINSKYNGSTIKFIYLLGDDTFNSKDRTKFFDFIIPIVPIVDSSNSYDKFIEYFKDYLKENAENSDSDYISYNLLNEISLYVDELRLVYNIYNEFTIYIKRLDNELVKSNQKIIYKYDKLLALITYKNIFPQDFVKLQYKSDSIVYRAFDIRKSYNRDNKTNLSLRDMVVQSYNKEIDKSLSKELTSLLSINRSPMSDYERSILKSQYFGLIIALLTGGYIDTQYTDYLTFFYQHSLNPEDKRFLQSFHMNTNFEANYELNRVAEITRRLDENKHRYSMPQILNYNLLEHLLEVKHQNVDNIINLIMTQKEYAFILQFVNYLFRKMEQIFSEYKIMYFETLGNREYVYNDEKINHYEIILKSFVTKINNKQNAICNELIEFNKKSPDDMYKLVKDYIITTLCYTTKIAKLKEMNISECIINLILEDDYFFNINSSTPLGFFLFSISKGMVSLNLKISKFDYNEGSSILLNELYKNNLYTINDTMLNLILSTQYNNISQKDIYHCNYTSITSDSNQPLVSYIHETENIDDYMAAMLKMSDGDINDSPEAAVNILNNEDMETLYKEKYIAFLKTKITSIASITDTELWDYLLKYNCIEYNSNNILDYYNEKCTSGAPYNDQLTSFVNSSNGDIMFKIPEGEDAKKTKQFLNATVKSVSLNDNRYYEILKDYSVETFNTPSLSDNKINSLISNKIINFSYSNLEFIRTNYPDYNIKYITQNLNDYVELQNTQTEISEIVTLLSRDLSEDTQNRLIEVSPEAISIEDCNFSDILEIKIIESQFDTDDLNYLASKYTSVSADYKVLISNKIADNITIIIEQINNNLLGMPEILLYDLLLLEEQTLSLENKKQLIHLLFSQNKINKISLQEARNVFVALGMTDFEQAIKPPNGGKPFIQLVGNNKDWLELLEKNHIINYCTRTSETKWHINGLHSSQRANKLEKLF